MRFNFKFQLFFTCLFLFFSQIIFAQATIEIKPVHFEKSKSSIIITDSIIGYQTIDYKMKALEGQLMSVNLQTSHLSNYFNVLAEGSENALFVGSISGNNWSSILPETGNYRIRVYLMRSAARRNEKASYNLSVQIKGQAVKEPDAKVGDTPYHATGEVSCSKGTDKKESSQCAFGVIRMGVGKADVYISTLNGGKRVINFEGKDVKTFDNQIKLKYSRGNDNWYININDQEFYTIPDAVINGG